MALPRNFVALLATLHFIAFTNAGMCTDLPLKPMNTLIRMQEQE